MVICFTELNGISSHTFMLTVISQTDPADLFESEPYTTVERVNIGYKGNNIQLQCKRKKMKNEQ